MMDLRWLMLIFALTDFIKFNVITAEEILGCGGFVKSEVPIDFSQIEIQLYTSEGLLKYQTECAPNNGYYMVPYVEKGTFVLKIKPPEGWLFEPMFVDLNVDGSTDDCSRGKDINFTFKGFIVSGQISSVGYPGVGPEGVTVELRLSEGKSTVKQTTQSQERGAFSFVGVLSGHYKVLAFDNSYQFDKSTATVTVKNSNTKCDNDLLVSGYNVQGRITVQDQPVSGVNLLLFTKEKLPKEIECSTKKPEGAGNINSPGYPLYVCAVTSTMNYIFKNLPPAEYAIVPFHKGKRTQYDVEPRVLHVRIVNSHLTSGNDFKVTGYSVQGRVLTHENGQPVAGAQVFVSDKLQGTTDASGYYTIKHTYDSGMTAKKETHLDINVKKEEMEFMRQKIKVGPDTSILPLIVPNAFSLCGRVNVEEPPSGFDPTRLVVEIASAKADSDVHIQTSHLDKNAGFCFMKATGDYTLKVTMPKDYEEKGLVLLPHAVKIKTNNAPLKTVAFYQHRTNAVFKVTCIDVCQNVDVEILSLGTGKKYKKTIKENINETQVEFGSLLPGKYSVHIHHDDWCWSEESTTVTVPREKAEVPQVLAHLKQSGFLLVCSISHDVEMVIRHDGEEVNTFSLKKGRNRLCLSSLGKYTLEPHSCHRFDIKPPIIYDTANPKPITLHAVAHQAIVSIETTKSYLSLNPEESKIPVQIRSSRGKVTNHYFELLHTEKKNSDSVIYRLTYWAADGENFEVIPSSDLLLFEPSSRVVAMQAGLCSEELARFKGIVGLFIDGHVTPPLADVNITITGTDKPIFMKTGKQGTYRVGPLHPDGNYEVSASLQDYALTAIPGKQGCFTAKKFSKLIFKISIENTQLPLPGVLISISGGSYRSNNLTGSDGTLTLVKLEPGSYYFKAIMKEYRFDPPSQVLEIVEGVKTEINIVGKRVAFSAYGRVSSLNGEPEAGAVVRAMATADSGDCLSLGEEGLTENDGTFRIKGLRPGCNYDVTVRNKDDKFSRVAPEIFPLTVANDDFTDIRFIAFRPLTGFELSGYVITSNEFLPFIKMVLYLAGEGASSAPVHVVSLTKESPFFQMPSIPRDGAEYIVRLECSLSATTYDYTAPAAGFFAVGPHKHVTFRFEPVRKAFEMETTSAPVFALPFAILVIILSYHHAAVLAFLQLKYRSIVKRSSGSDNSGRGRKTRK